ncbi:MAG: hypothetical protein KF690_06950 [Bacteroidetes bacterium]|nr:hypothetical protein [Bacteroidota bacterium]
MDKRQENVFWRQVLAASRHWNLSEDVVQDAILLYLEKGFPENEETIPILYGIAWRMQRDAWKAELNLKSLEQQYGRDHKPSEETESSPPDPNLALAILSTRMDEVLGKEDSAIFWRYASSHDPLWKIALETRKSRQAVYRILHRAISWLESDYGPKVKFRLHKMRKQTQ